MLERCSILHNKGSEDEKKDIAIKGSARNAKGQGSVSQRVD